MVTLRCCSDIRHLRSLCYLCTCRVHSGYPVRLSPSVYIYSSRMYPLDGDRLLLLAYTPYCIFPCNTRNISHDSHTFGQDSHTFGKVWRLHIAEKNTPFKRKYEPKYASLAEIMESAALLCGLSLPNPLSSVLHLGIVAAITCLLFKYCQVVESVAMLRVDL